MILRRRENYRIDKTIAHRFRWISHIEHELDALLDGVRHTGVHWIPAHQIEDNIDLIDLIAIDIDGPIECDVQMRIVANTSRTMCICNPRAVHVLNVGIEHFCVALCSRVRQLTA